MSRSDVVASCETAKRIVDALLVATSEDVHEKLTRLDKGQPGSVLRSLRLTRDRLTGERGSEIMLKGTTAERLKVRVNELVGNVGLVGASVFDLSEEDREHANRAPVALSIPLRDELVRASSTLDRLLGSAVELRSWRENKEAELASLVETSDPAVNAIRHQRRVEIDGEITLVNQRETELLGDVYEVSNAVRRGLEERSHFLSNLIRLGLGPNPKPQIIPSPNVTSSPPELDQELILKVIEILTKQRLLTDEVKRFIESVFETLEENARLLTRHVLDYYSELLTPNNPEEWSELSEWIGSAAQHVAQPGWQLPLNSFLQPTIRKSIGRLGTVAFTASAAYDAFQDEWSRQQKQKGKTQYSDTQIVVHSTLDAAAEGIVSFVVIEGVGKALNGVPYVGPFLSVGYKVFVGPPFSDFVNEKITAPIMDNKDVEAAIDGVYEASKDALAWGARVFG